MDAEKKVILVVEDNHTAAVCNKILFEKSGCKVEHADDGEKALEMVKNNHFDAISMDIGLPGISGVEACIAIREHEKKNRLDPMVIIAVTANKSPEEEQEYLKAGMQAVIKKPLSQESAKYFLSFL